MLQYFFIFILISCPVTLNRMALQRHIFIHVQGHFNVISKSVPDFTIAALAQSGIQGGLS